MTGSKWKTLFFWMLLIVQLPLHAETERLKNPFWREVPGTDLGVDDPDFSGAVHIEMTGLSRRSGGILAFDVAQPDNSYVRLEVDCARRLFRATRLGDFPSQNQIQFVRTQEPWKSLDDQAGNLYIESIFRFVCRS